jgi:DNA-binding HxlR family transcriptional regulator
MRPNASPNCFEANLNQALPLSCHQNMDFPDKSGKSSYNEIRLIEGDSLKRISFALIAFTVFTTFESVLALDFVLSTTLICHDLYCNGVGSVTSSAGPGFGLWSYSIPLSIGGWFVVGATLLWRRRIPSVWKSAGFDRTTFNLMMKMRGAGSRLEILRLLEAPKHRNELSQLAGFDWKEVDRQLRLLERYGLASVYAQSGSVKLYTTTEQGKLLLSLIERLEKDQSMETDTGQENGEAIRGIPY